MARKLGDALPGGESALRANIWELVRPMLSRALVALNHDAFVIQDEGETTVDLASRHAASSPDDLDLDELTSAAAWPITRRSLPLKPHRTGRAEAGTRPGSVRSLFFSGWPVQHVR
jgi:hypothetical protein